MSSTNRGSQRNASDYYLTPLNDIMLFLNTFCQIESEFMLIKDLNILDPCAGGSNYQDMSYPKALALINKELNITTVDIREDSKAEIKADYLNYYFKEKFDLIITNPPFSDALAIIRKALTETKPGGFVIMLLRLNFFGSQIRFPFWKENLPKYAFIHHKRISFTDGATDSIEYMHAVWQVGTNQQFTKLKVI